MISLTSPHGVLQWRQLFRLYRKAFPASERKPFSMIRKMYRLGRTDIWCVQRNGKFLGLAITINSPEIILLDYFAVEDQYRGQGIGGEALAALRKAYPGKGLFVEIESPYEEGSDQALRQRRKDFYLRCGGVPMEVMVRLFGVKMELIGWDCRLDFQQYHSFYHDNYSPWAAEHILPEVYPR